MSQAGPSAPAYRLTELLGVRPVGWTGGAAPEVVLDEGGPGVLPSAGSHVPLPPLPSTLVAPLPGGGKGSREPRELPQDVCRSWRLARISFTEKSAAAMHESAAP